MKWRKCFTFALTTVLYCSLAGTSSAQENTDGEERCAIDTLSTLSECTLLLLPRDYLPRNDDSIRQKEAINTLPLFVLPNSSIGIPLMKERRTLSGNMEILTMDLVGTPTTPIFPLPTTFEESLKIQVPRKTTTTMDSGFDEEIAGHLQQLMDELIAQEENKIGVISRVDMGNKSWRGVGGYSRMPASRSYNYKYRGEREVFTNKFRIASITKTFVADLILQLVRNKRLSLDDTIKQWFPHAPNANKVTIRYLLRHQTGYYDYTSLPEMSFYFQERPLKVFTPQELLKKAFRENSCFEPGRVPACYSNTNYIIAGLIVEEIMGMPLEEIINQCMLERWTSVESLEERLCLRWVNTAFPIDASIPQFYTSAYMWHNDTDTLKNDGTFIDSSFLWSAGAMVSNMDDVINAIKTQVKGIFIGEYLLQQRLEVIEIANLNALYGLGIMQVPTNNDDSKKNFFNRDAYFGHCGGLRGYQNCVFYNPHQDIAVSVNLNIYPSYIDSYTYIRRMIDIVEGTWIETWDKTTPIIPEMPMVDEHERTLIEVISNIIKSETTPSISGYCGYCNE
jgi:CubicO group peptidase (beta-lactamase class C family)